jgi:hypothetical protein
MRRLHLRIAQLAAAAIALLAVPVAAQIRDDVPPVDVKPPAMAPLDDTLEPQVTIIKRQGSTVEEYRINGKLYKIKVTPENGVPYTLIDQRGDGSFSGADAPGTPGLSVPTWVIGTF